MKYSEYCIYVLKSKMNGSYYIGSTKDIKNRLKEHNAKQVQSTARYIPWKLVYKESFVTLSEAYKRERQIKKYKGGQAFKQLLKQGEVA